MSKKIKVVVNFGHGGPDSGAVGNGLKEKDLTKAIGKRITKLLRDNYDVEVKEIRQSQSGGGLTQITNEANNWGADIFVSIHINSGGGTGFESFIFNGYVSNDTKKLQNAIHDAVIKEINVTDRGKKTANFAVLRQTKMPAVLTENMFIDTKADADKLKDSKFLDKVAQGHVNGIANFLGLKDKSGSGSSSFTTKSSKPKKESSNNNKGLGLVDWMKSQKMDSSYNNRKKLAAQYGINNYSGTASQNNTLLSKLKGGKPETEKSSENLKVDGYMGKLTISALQRYFGTVVDGYLSRPSLVIRKLQALLGEEEDGYLGPITIKALQKRFGTVQDGVISKPSLVIKELQRRLNKGKL